MTARSFGEIALGVTASKVYRTFQPVRRNSYNVGEREPSIWGALDRKEVGARIKAARAFDRTQRVPGEKWGPLGPIGLEVLEAMYGMVNFKTGQLDPSIDFICGKIHRSRNAVIAALARLKEVGFLKWIRRTEPTNNHGKGPQVRQVSNAYWFALPAKAAALVAKILGKDAPIPDCEAQRRAEVAAETERHFHEMPLSEVGSARMGDDPHGIGAILDRIGERLSREPSVNASPLTSPES